MYKSFILYKTTNTVNGKYYIGVHQQIGVNFDGYLGSGTSLKAAVKKYGRSKFTRETLEVHILAETAYSREVQLLRDVYKTVACYNQHPGGRGIRDYSTLSVPTRKPMSEERRAANKHRMLTNNPNYMEGVREKISKSKRGKRAKGAGTPITIDGVNYTSRRDACKLLNITYPTALRRARQGSSTIRKLTQGNPIPLEVGGVLYASFYEAKLALFPHVSEPTARKRLTALGAKRMIKQT